ncbi:putative succinyl-CoA:3-ketoacid coenzyme A transferase subunit B [Candidatus Entotheonellaceae bacterium PAL068K]
MPNGLSREQIAQRAAQELRDGFTVNLGIGIPTLVANYVPPGIEIILHAQNGVLGCGRLAAEGEEDPDLINAGAQYITLQLGACCFDSAMSFAMIRGGHLDMTILGGLQVSAQGDLANWRIPEREYGSIGGAMDLVNGARRVIVTMEHCARNGAAKIVEACTYPLTGVQCVDLIITDLAVIDITSGGLVLRQVAPGVSVNHVQERTDAPLQVADDIRDMQLLTPSGS